MGLKTIDATRKRGGFFATLKETRLRVMGGPCWSMVNLLWAAAMPDACYGAIHCRIDPTRTGGGFFATLSKDGELR